MAEDVPYYEFTNVEMADMHLMYGLAQCNGREARRLYEERFPNRVLPAHSTFASIHLRLSETGKFQPLKVGRSGRPRSVRTPRLEEEVLDEIFNNPEKSTREVALDFGVNNKIVWQIFHENSLYPYHIQRVHALLPGDYDRRVELCRWLIRKCRQPNFLKNILFTDEAQFTRNAIFNCHNSHVWAVENPHTITQNRHQHQFSLNVWAGIIGDTLLIWFLPATLDGPRYLHFLTVDLPPLLEDLPLNRRNILWFMLDGAPPHFSLAVRAHLDQTYPNKWIGRGGPAPWPARSPDLNPLDFFLWGHLKTIVYATPVENVEELRDRIVAGVQRIRDEPGIFQNVRRSMMERLNVCLQNGGRHFEHLL